MRSSSTRFRPGALGRRLIALPALAAVGCAAVVIGAAPPAAAATLLNPTWTTSASTTAATGVSYTYTFTAATTASISSVTMTVPGTVAGSPGIGTVSPAITPGGSATHAGSTLTYSFTAVTVAAGTFLSIQLTGLTNPTAASTPTSVITTSNGDSGTSGAVQFTTNGFIAPAPAYTVSSAVVGATSVSYTFTFTAPANVLGIFTGATITVPPGTAGIPVLGTVSPGSLLGLGTISLAGNTLTYNAGLSLSLLTSVSFSIQVTGLINTATAGAYTAEIATTGTVYSGVTGPVNLTGPLTLTSPSAVAWPTTTLTGTNLSLVDGTAAQQQFTVNDETATGANTAAGWHITVAATTFTSGAKTLPDSGTLVLTGSLASATAATGPTVACVVSCTPPASTTTYPVGITTTPAGLTAVTVFDTPAKTGLGPVLIGGSSAVRPVGWWLSIPAGARAGTYTSTVTVTVVSGP
jgi:hypothetical protein